MKKIIIGFMTLTCLFPLSGFAGDQKTESGFGAATAAFSKSIENYIELSSNTESGVFLVISETSLKNAARREVLLAVFVRYLAEEQRALITLRKDVEGILNLAESEMPGPDTALAEMSRVEEYLNNRGLIKWGKVLALETALTLPASKFEDISKMGALFYSVNPTQDAAADAYAAVRASRGTLTNLLKELDRSVFLAELAAAGDALRAPQAAKNNTVSKQGKKRVLVSESIFKSGGELP